MTAFLFVLYFLSIVFVLVSVVVVRWNWNAHPRLRARGFIFLAATALGVLIFLQSGPLQESLGKRRIPCLWNLVSTYLVVPLLGGALIGRLMDSMNKTNLARAMMVVPLDNADDRVTRRGRWCARWNKGLTSRKRLEHSSSMDIPSIIRRKSHEPGIAATPLPSQKTPIRKNLIDDLSPQHYVSKNEFRFWKALSSRRGRFLLMFLILLPSIVASVVIVVTESDSYLRGCSGCALSNPGLFVLVFTACAIVLFALVASIRVRKFPDPYGIVRECRQSFLLGGIMAIVCFALDKWAPIKGDKFSWIIPEIIGVLIMFFIHGPLQLYLAIQEERKNRALSLRRENGNGLHNSNTSPELRASRTNIRKAMKPTFEEVLDDPQGFSAFEHFLISAWAVESLRFYVEAKEWTLDFHDMGYRTALSRARRIVRVFIDINGTMTVNLDHEIVGKLKQVLHERDDAVSTTSIASKNGRPVGNSVETAEGDSNHSSFLLDQEFFVPAIDEITKLMRSDSFFRFRSTDAYIEFAEEWKERQLGMYNNGTTVSNQLSPPLRPKKDAVIVEEMVANSFKNKSEVSFDLDGQLGTVVKRWSATSTIAESEQTPGPPSVTDLDVV